MASDRSVERIELIVGDDRADWALRTEDVAPADGVGAVGARGDVSRWRGTGRRGKAIAVIAVVAIAVAVGVSFGDASPSRSSPPTAVPSFTAPSSTAPASSAPATTPPASTSSGRFRFRLVSDPPPGFAVGAAEESEPGRNSDTASIDGAGVSMLWSDAPEAAPGSRWFLATVLPGRPLETSVGDVRLAVAGGVALATRTANGIMRLAGPVDGGSGEIVSSGLGVHDVVSVLDGLSLVAGKLLLDEGAVPAGLQLRSSSQGHGPARWSPVVATTVTYPSTASQITGALPTITVATGSRPTDFQQVVEWFFLVGSTRVDVDGEIALLGANPLTGERALTFDRSGVHVVISGATADHELVQIAATLHQADEEEWSARSALPMPAAGGATGALQVHHPPGATDVYGFDLEPTPTPHSGDGAGTQATAPSIRWASSVTDTAIVAGVPSDDVGALLRVTIGTVVTQAPLIAAAGSAQFVGVVVFSEPGLFTAQIVAADGTVLASTSPLAE